MNLLQAVLFSPITYNVIALAIFAFLPKTTRENVTRKIISFLISIPVVFNMNHTYGNIIKLPQNVDSTNYFFAHIKNSLIKDLLLPLVFAEVVYVASKVFIRSEDDLGEIDTGDDGVEGDSSGGGSGDDEE